MRRLFSLQYTWKKNVKKIATKPRRLGCFAAVDYRDHKCTVQLEDLHLKCLTPPGALRSTASGDEKIK